jgi:transcription initiation factor IIF auxiliary subunit
MLHPSYKKPKITCTKAPFTCWRKAWGYFEIKVKIYFKTWLRQKPMEFEHMLVFEKAGSKSIITIEIPKPYLPMSIKRHLGLNPKV